MKPPSFQWSLRQPVYFPPAFMSPVWLGVSNLATAIGLWLSQLTGSHSMRKSMCPWRCVAPVCTITLLSMRYTQNQDAVISKNTIYIYLNRFVCKVWLEIATISEFLNLIPNNTISIEFFDFHLPLRLKHNYKSGWSPLVVVETDILCWQIHLQRRLLDASMIKLKSRYAQWNYIRGIEKPVPHPGKWWHCAC